MHFEKTDIEEYLRGVWTAIDAGKYQIASRPKNQKRTLVLFCKACYNVISRR